jgi:AraC-like DNA-binding protein
MRSSTRAHEPHLALRDRAVPPGGEWAPRLTGWFVLRIRAGDGYWLQPNQNLPLAVGAVVVAPGEAPVVLRASHLSRLEVQYFTVVPRRLGGLLTLTEQNFLQAASRTGAFQILPPQHLVALRMQECCASAGQPRLADRLKLLQVFVEAVGDEPGPPPSDQGPAEARERLRQFLAATPASELLEMSTHELAQRTHCTARHLSRIFRELVGVSFQEKRAELRLARARELLATSDSKIVDVALESGFKSLSLFNLMFSRRFGASPGQWRHRHGRPRAQRGKRAPALAAAPA